MVTHEFKESHASLIPNDWDTVKLSDIFVSLEAGVSVNSDDNADTGCYVLKTSAVSNGAFISSEKKHVVPQDCSRVKCSVVGDSLIISRMNTPQLVGESAFVDCDMNDCYLPDRLWLARNYYPTQYDFRWLSYILNYGQYREEIRLAGSGTSNSMKNISKESMLMITIPKPPIEEQKKISEALYDIDMLVEQLLVEINKLLNVKEAHLSQMFAELGCDTPDERIPGFNGKWKRIKLGDCFGERQERYAFGTLLSVSIDKGVRKFSESGRVDNSSENKSNYKLVEIGDIAYNSMRMWQGASGYSEYRGIVSPAYTVLFPKQNVYSRFFSYMFKRKSLVNTFKMFSQGLTSDTWNLKYPALSEIEVMVPDVDEQEAISKYLLDIDFLIEGKRLQLKKYMDIKQGMMSELLTGKTRLV